MAFSNFGDVGGQYEWANGVAHPLIDPFHTMQPNQTTTGECYSMDEMSMALGQVVNWITNDGNFQQRGVYNRAMTLGFLMQAPELGIKNQAQLSRKLNLSRSQTNALVRGFTNKFQFETSSQRVRKPAKGKGAE